MKHWGERMKYIPIYVFIILSLLSACSQEKTEDADVVIEEAELTSFEENLMNMMNNSAIVYDVEVNNEDIEDLQLTVDYYEKSEFVDQVVDMSTMVASEEGPEESIRAVFTQSNPVENEEQWIAAVMTNSGYSSGESPNKNVKDRKEMSSTWGGVNLPVDLKKGEKQVIGSMIYTNENTVSGTSNIETEENLKEATDYEQVYILSIEAK